jgi:hypothetical protein
MAGNGDLQRFERLISALYSNMRPAAPAQNRVLMAYKALTESVAMTESVVATLVPLQDISEDVALTEDITTGTLASTDMKWGEPGTVYCYWGMGEWQ